MLARKVVFDFFECSLHEHKSEGHLLRDMRMQGLDYESTQYEAIQQKHISIVKTKHQRRACT